MTESVKIAVDAMGGDNSPEKIIEGILHNHNSLNKDNFYKIFGDESLISNLLGNNIDKKFYEIVHTVEKVQSTDTPLEAAKRGKKNQYVACN